MPAAGRAATPSTTPSTRSKRLSKGSASASDSRSAERDEEHDNNDDAGSVNAQRAKKKQKRNKPTLSCSECVERKTKVSLPSLLCQRNFGIGQL
jgi:hypothetical protein